MSQNTPGLTSHFEIYDSEIDKIQHILEILRRRAEGSVDYDAFDREIKDRFAKIGFKVDVKWWTTNVEGTLLPEIDIQDRLEKIEFDHDRQVSEVTNDILGLGDAGVIKFDPSQYQKPTHGHQH